MGVLAVVALTALAIPTLAGAETLQPTDVRVDGGEESWHADPGFAVRWSNPAGVAAVHYRLLDPVSRQLGGDLRIAPAVTALQHLNVPEVDGAYTVEIWLEDGAGAEGPPASARLRFDGSPPGDVEPSTGLAWIGRTAFPLTLRLAHPGDPLPVSGIRGYAVSIDRAPDGEPCEDRHLCSESETDLREGVGDDALEIDSLPEGTSYAHAAAVSGSGVRSAGTGTTVLRVDATDPTTTLRGVPAGWSDRPVRLEAAAVDGGSGMNQVGAGPTPFTAIRVDDGAPVAAAGSLATTTVIGDGVHVVAYYARDAAGNVDDGGSSNGQANRRPREAVVKVDRAPPLVAFANAQDPADPERIDAVVVDPLSGVDTSLGSVAVRPVGSTERFRALPTTVSESKLSARWDSQSLAAGEYEFRATAHDRAGNVSTTTARLNGAPMQLRNPLKVPTTLVAAFRHGDSSALPCGRRATLEGRLTSGRGTPLSGEQVWVHERFAAGSDLPERVTAAPTDRSGKFSLRLGPGPSRTAVAVAAPTARRQGARSRTETLAVRSCVALRSSSPVAEVGGRPIVFHGRVGTRGAEVPRNGIPVELQFRLPGLPWSEFRTVETDRRGRFHYAYRFADDDSRGVRFRFRAYVAERAGWPIEPAGSRPVVVRGI
jgi:hypothetical protein